MQRTSDESGEKIVSVLAKLLQLEEDKQHALNLECKLCIALMKRNIFLLLLYYASVTKIEKGLYLSHLAVQGPVHRSNFSTRIILR